MELYYDDWNSFRPFTCGNYATDFKNIETGHSFPDNETISRNKLYDFNHKLFTGEYCQDKNLIAVVDGNYQEIPYRTLPLNYFELIVNKLDSLLFSNELTVKTGDIGRDNEVNKLIDRTRWTNTVREAVKLAQIYGDCVLKTGRHGASAVPPIFAYKVLDESDKKRIKGIVYREILYDKQEGPSGTIYTPEYIRILVSGVDKYGGYEFERVFEYTGSNRSGLLGKPVRFKYRDRWIPKSGRLYRTGLECNTSQWLAVNSEKDVVYGTSSFSNVRDIIFAIENRLSTENWVIDAHGKPLLVVGMGMMEPNNFTGGYIPRIINGKYLINMGEGSGFIEPKYIEWDGKLDASQKVREDLMSAFYELSELGKCFLSGEYTGNISEESLNNIIKSALDRGGREINSIWYDIRQSLYVLCCLNGININIEDINIEFHLGRTDDDKQVAEICGLLTTQGILSKQTVLNRYFGYNEDQALAELERIKIENAGGVGDNDTTGKVETVIRE